MSRIKKIVLGLSVALTMAIAFVVGVIGLNQTSIQAVGDSNVSNSNNLEFKLEEEKPTIITHAPNEIKVEKGGDTINYSYKPDNNVKDNAKVVAYEYVFGATEDDMAVDITGMDIDVEGVDISYIYSDSRIDTTGTLDSFTNYNIQKVTTSSKWKYIYIVVSAQNELPTNFIKDIKWCYGKAGEVTIANNINNETSTITIVKGAEMQRPIQIAPSGNGYEVGGWYLDEACTIPAPPILTSGQTLYAQFPNLPSDWLTLEEDHYVVTTGESTLPNNLVIPGKYNGKPITRINQEAFTCCYDFTSVDLRACTNLTIIGRSAFNDTGLNNIKLPSGLTTIESGAFAGAY